MTESESAFGNIAKVDNNVVNHKFENKQLFLIRKSNGEKIVINKDKFVIGKSKFSDYQVRGNSTVSRSHIIVTCQSDGSLIIEDNNSKNGTFVDGIRVGPHERFKLEAGQSLRLSDEIFDICDV